MCGVVGWGANHRFHEAGPVEALVILVLLFSISAATGWYVPDIRDAINASAGRAVGNTTYGNGWGML
jgi:hypothetical protein